jgi:transcriptional accessory protein Tex/SPT6
MVGRPTNYSQDIIDKTKEYIETYKTQGDQIPSVEGLSEFIGIARATIYRWATEKGKEEFKDTLDTLQAKQKRVLLNKGLSGDFNSNITKLALGNHGMSEKTQQEVSGPDGKPQEHKWTIELVEAKHDK